MKGFSSPRLFRSVWVVGTCVLLVPPVIGWFSAPVSLKMPETPVDHVNPLYARQWVLLQQAKELVPRGESYTVIARDKDEEMALFMLSIGVLVDRTAAPSSYWNRPEAESGSRARYVVSFECLEPTGPKRLVGRLSNGCVWDRQGARP